MRSSGRAIFGLVLLLTPLLVYGRVLDAPDSGSRNRPQCIQVISFNLQNLFLPRNAVMEKSLKSKFEALKLAVDTNFDLSRPHILLLQEVASDRVLRDWLSYAWPDRKYFVESDGSAEGVLHKATVSTMPLSGDKRTHVLADPNSGYATTVLEVELASAPDRQFGAFNVHFPAATHPLAVRKRLFSQLSKLLSTASKNDYVIVGGDFNLPNSEWPTFSEDIGALKQEFVFAADELSADVKGTFYHKKSKAWVMLDWILIGKRFFNVPSPAWYIDKPGTLIGNKYKSQVQVDGTPRRFLKVSGEGVSDHFPVTTTLCY